MAAILSLAAHFKECEDSHRIITKKTLFYKQKLQNELYALIIKMNQGIERAVNFLAKGM